MSSSAPFAGNVTDPFNVASSIPNQLTGVTKAIVEIAV